MKAGKSGVEGCPWLRFEFQVGHNYMASCLKKQKQTKSVDVGEKQKAMEMNGVGECDIII